MHVLIIPSWYPSHPGDISGSFFREQALALSKNGCRVGVIYPELRSLRKWGSILSGPNGISVEQDEAVATYRSRGMNWFPRTTAATSRLFAWHGRRLYERYVEENGAPDIVHVHSLLLAGPVAAGISRNYGVPFVITEHSTAFARKLISARGLSIAKNVSALAARKFAVSDPFARLLTELLGTETDTWEEMPNIVNERFLTYPLPPKKVDKNFQFINIALMNEKKGQANILYAFAQTCKSHPNVRLTLGGDGPERSKLEQLARDLGIAKKVRFTGQLTRVQVPVEMAAADALVVSSRYETFGVVVIEALALGKPVIATRCGGPESIVRKEDGILIPVDDIGALAAAMRQLLENHGDYNPSQIRRACLARYSETAIAERLRTIYTEILN